MESPYHDVRAILPRWAINARWLKMMGNARTEQKALQDQQPYTEQELRAIAKAERRKARRMARRSGYAGLLDHLRIA